MAGAQAAARPFCAPENRRWILAAAILASAMGFIDGSVVSIALPTMRADLGTSLAGAQWISNAYLLTLSALILAGGALGDRLGLARVFGGGIAVFVAASVGCALAPDAVWLIAARAVQGIGAAAMVPGSLAIISRAYPAAERGAAIGLWAAASAVTTGAGPILGGLLLTFGDGAVWRLIFAVNLPLGAAALWILRAHVARDARAADPAPVDVAGALLATAGLGLLALALTAGEGGLPAGATALAAAAGVAALALFLRVEARQAHPMMPLDLFRDHRFSAANAATFLLYFALTTILFFLPMTVIATWGVSPIGTTVAFLPLTLFMTLLSRRFGRLADRTGPGPVIAAGATLVGLAFAVYALVAPHALFWSGIVPAAVVMGFGMSLVVAPLSAAVMGSAGDDDAGAASGINNAVSRIAGLVAVAAMGSIAAWVYRAAGGPASFAAETEGAEHAAATARAFAALCWVASLMAFAAALTAWRGIGGMAAAAPARQPSA